MFLSIVAWLSCQLHRIEKKLAFRTQQSHETNHKRKRHIQGNIKNKIGHRYQQLLDLLRSTSKNSTLDPMSRFWLSSRNFFQGGTIVMQISFVMLIFLLFSDQILRGTKVSEWGSLPERGASLSPCGGKPGSDMVR